MIVRVFVKIGRKQELLGWDGKHIVVRVDAPPIDGAANKKLVEIMSDWLGISKSEVRVSKGHTARYKTLDIDVADSLFAAKIESLPRLFRQDRLL